MPDAIGHTKNLDASRTEALQGLLSSLRHTNDDSSSGATLSTEQRRKLSENINEILGDGADHNLTLGGQPSQLLNEDGFPIVDISEPVNEDSQTSTSPSPLLEQDLTPFTLLPPDEGERRRRERDRILDLLEEEEHLQQLQEERDAEEERKEAIRKRKESVRAELDRLKAARELQKKMGQALVRHAKGTGENRQDENARFKPQSASSASAKKSVSFADAPIVKADERDQQASICQPDWGDVTPGRLRAQSRIPLVSTAEAEKYPLKMRVVERRSRATTTSPFHNDADSDDESTSSAGHLSPRMENDSSDEEDRSSSNNNGLSDDEQLEEGFDYDAAQHHREIALEYHKKRHAIGAETTRAMAAHPLDDYEQHETLQSNGQVPLSRLRADRMAAAYDKSHGPVSTSIGQTVVPASRQKSLRNSVRLGKLENDQLVGGDSGESEDETLKEVIQMLQMGSIQNAGPDFNTVESPSVGTPTAAHGAKPSRFKLARRGGITETTTFQDNESGDNARSQPAVLSVVERKAPRSSPSQHFPINKPPLRSPVKISEPAPPMIIDSSSFPTTASASTVTIPSSSPHPITIGSPSPHQTQLERPPLVKSSATQDSIIQFRVSPRDPLSAERPISKFMAERKK